MTKSIPGRSGQEAAKELKKLHDAYANKPEGYRLTIEVIMAGIGVTQQATISRWINGHHYPKGAILGNLAKFLDKAKDRAWLERFIEKNSFTHGRK
jgi:transcriptional regulator with XRE-family HTH domain